MVVPIGINLKIPSNELEQSFLAQAAWPRTIYVVVICGPPYFVYSTHCIPEWPQMKVYAYGAPPIGAGKILIAKFIL